MSNQDVSQVRSAPTQSDSVQSHGHLPPEGPSGSSQPLPPCLHTHQKTTTTVPLSMLRSALKSSIFSSFTTSPNNSLTLELKAFQIRPRLTTFGSLLKIFASLVANRHGTSSLTYEKIYTKLIPRNIRLPFSQWGAVASLIDDIASVFPSLYGPSAPSFSTFNMR